MIDEKNMQLLRLISEKQKKGADLDKLALTQMIKANEELGEASAELLALSKSKQASASATGSSDALAEELIDVLSCVLDMLVTQGVTEHKLNEVILTKMKKWSRKLLPQHQKQFEMQDTVDTWTLWDDRCIEVMSFSRVGQLSTALSKNPLTVAEHNKVTVGAMPYARLLHPEQPVFLTRKEANDFIESLNYILACNCTHLWQTGYSFCFPTEDELWRRGLSGDLHWAAFPSLDGKAEKDTKKMLFVAFGS